MPDDRYEAREQLREVARGVLHRAGGVAGARALYDHPVDDDVELYAQMAELGWAGLLIPEPLGGSGGGLPELAVVLEELGRVLRGGPLLATGVLATTALLEAGSDEQQRAVLPCFADGSVLGTAALSGPTGRCEVAELGMRIRRKGTGFRLDGEAAFVPDAGVADLVVVAALDDNGRPSLVLVETATPGFEAGRLPMMDGTRRLSRVRFDDVAVSAEALLGEWGEAGPVLDRIMAAGAVALAADAAGGARRALELSADYAKDRVQFGRAIGTFQAIKHKLADMYVLVEGASAAVEAAAVEPAARGSVAKAYAGDAYANVAGEAILVHGAIGFTWEYDLHLFLKRAKLDQQLLGDSQWHRARALDRALAELAAA